jgi:hypothetical protein
MFKPKSTILESECLGPLPSGRYSLDFESLLKTHGLRVVLVETFRDGGLLGGLLVTGDMLSKRILGP